jgi:hypothetical protein
MFTQHNQQVTVNRLALLDILKANRSKHAADFEEARANWKTALTVETAALAAKTASGDFQDILIESTKPTHSLYTYDEAIEMLSMSVDENITLDKPSFRNYVKDEWHFKTTLSHILAANASVSAKYLG